MSGGEIDHKPEEIDEKQLIPRMTLNDNKAGMQGVDKEKINKVIMENTVGSRYYKNEQKRDAQVQERILSMKNRLSQYSEQEKKSALMKADLMLNEFEKDRNLTRTIIHIDMDAFYASVEERDQPHLKTKPMAVGGMDMLSTSNYVARKYGVRAAMPGFIAKKLCPELIIVPLNFTKYKEVSHEIQSIYSEYDESFMAASLDEAYLDVTDHVQSRVLLSENQRTFQYNPELLDSSDRDNKSKTFGFSAEEVSEEIRFRIHQKTRLTASAGIGPNLMLAKIGSDLNKPNGQAFIPSEKDSILGFMKDLPLRKVSGIGKVSEQLLTALGVRKCGDLLEQRAMIVLLFSSLSSSFFLRVGLGCSSNRVCQDGEQKSISTERTFNAISNERELFSKLKELCQALSVEMSKKEVQGKTVTFKTKTVDFQIHTRSKTSSRPISDASELFDIAKTLLKQEMDRASNKLSLRLMGIGMSKLETLSGHQQKTIKGFFAKPSSSSAEFKKPTFSAMEQTHADADINDDETFSFFAENKVDFETEKLSIATKSDSEHQLKHNKSSKNLIPDNNYVCPICSSRFAELSKLDEHLEQCGVTEQKISGGKSTSSNSINDFTCPICLVVFNTTLQLFNSHVDSCLSRQAIKDILKNDACSKIVRPAVKSPPKANKRRKVIPKHTNTLEKFFS